MLLPTSAIWSTHLRDATAPGQRHSSAPQSGTEPPPFSAPGLQAWSTSPRLLLWVISNQLGSGDGEKENLPTPGKKVLPKVLASAEHL